MITIIIITSIVVTAGLGLPDGTPEQYKQTLKSWKTAIIDHVEDEGREEQALAILDRVATVLVKNREEVDSLRERVYEVDARYDATLEDYEAAITSLNGLLHKTDLNLIAQRFEMQGVLTQQEWITCLGAIHESTSKHREKMKKKLEKDDHKRAKQKEKLKTAR